MSGDSRFEIRRTLGEGGMGVVYEARDTQRDMVVALKTLRTLDANLLYHFKNEFRALSDLNHPNLCTLYELFQSEGHWFFTMEMVEGTDFTDWIRPKTEAKLATIPASEPQGTLIEFGGGRSSGGTLLEFANTASAIAPVTGPASATPVLPFDEPRLRDALAQLAAGLDALHEAGKVHRDIKPNNILVTPEGRVVIMDFGLVADSAILQEFKSSRMIAGTPTYMAPEQAMPGVTVGPSADWYAVGVILYEILTCRLPHSGATLQELTEAKRTPPPAAAQVAFGVPLDLADLCHRMLSPDPASRPSGAEVIRVLGGRASAPSLGTHQDIFVGRRAELGVLHTALAESRRAAVSVFVEGPSGLGKSALVKRFLDEVENTGTLILRGRCYAEETVPYKAFDGIVDALSRHLLQLDYQSVATLLPSSTALAARLFPVLRRVPIFANAVTYDPNVGAQEMRARAFAAVVELLGRIAASQPLVLFVDDLQWADPDSVLLLRELLRPEAAPPLTFVASIRTGGGAASVGNDLAADLAKSARIEPRWIKLAPLSPDDATLLVDRLLPASGSRREEILREAGGHPLFLAELAHHLSVHSGSELTTKLDEALWQRAMALEHEARHLLQVIAVAGTPVDLKTVADAAGLSPTRVAPLATALRIARFVKTSVSVAGSNLVEPYHDRVREAIVARLERSQFAAVSSHLAHAMLRVGMGETSPELVVRHLFAGGDSTRGRDLAERAAQRALALLAFERAAEFLRSALAAGARDADHARALHLALANALASAGRGGEAAEAFLAAAALASGDAQLDCRRHAADQLLVSGNVDRGLAELSDVLAQLGELIPNSPREAHASMEAERLQIDSAPIILRERSLSEIPAPLLRRLDVYQSTSLGLLLVDNVRGADFQARAVRLALAAGDPRRLLRATVFEAIYRAQEGETGRARAAELLAAATSMALLRDEQWNAAYLGLGHAWLAYYHGRFRRAVELFKDADVRFRALPGVAWEQNMIRIHRLRATDYQGAWGELRALYDEYLRDAQRRDDRYVEASITRWFNVLWLAHDQPGLAGADLDRRTWTPPEPGRYHLQHFLELRARVELALYRGDGAKQGAWARPGLEAADRSLVLRIQIARAIADWLLGRIAACEHDVVEIERRAQLLTQQGVNYAAVWSGLLAGAALAQRGDRAGAVAKLEDTAALAETNDFNLCAAIARLRAGQLTGAQDQIDASLAWMGAQDIRNPLRMCEVFAPGF